MDLLEKLKVYVNSDEFKKSLNINGEINLSILAMGEYNINYLFVILGIIKYKKLGNVIKVLKFNYICPPLRLFIFSDIRV